MDRTASLDRLIGRTDPWDVAVVGGGATGVGIAVDAASRGYSCCLLDRSDFGQGTSSRSTKLVHGGVRYLRQGNVPLVMGALRERELLRRNAPHLVHDLAFVVPLYQWWERAFYGAGMKLYDLLAVRSGFGRSRHLSRAEVLERVPTIRPNGLRGGVVYHDGQFDDSRLLVSLCRTADACGATLVNHAAVTSLSHGADGRVDGLTAVDGETGRSVSVKARCVVNATGAFADAVRRLDDPAAEPMVSPSQGVHVVLDRAFLPGDTAIIVPRTPDGRVMFAIPWHGKVVVGTTDTPVDEAAAEPTATAAEVDFILDTAGRYLARPPTRADVRSVFTGVRPLVKADGNGGTAALSRDHTIRVSPGGLLTITGGKWTTYRHMAEEAVDRAAEVAGLDRRPGVTATMPVHGYAADADGPLAVYGSDAAAVADLGSDRLDADLPLTVGQVRWAVRREMARTVDDVLSRRTRALLLDAAAAVRAAPRAAEIMAGELGRDTGWVTAQVAAFAAVAGHYRVPTSVLR